MKQQQSRASGNGFFCRAVVSNRRPMARAKKDTSVQLNCSPIKRPRKTWHSNFPEHLNSISSSGSLSRSLVDLNPIHLATSSCLDPAKSFSRCGCHFAMVTNIRRAGSLGRLQLAPMLPLCSRFMAFFWRGVQIKLTNWCNGEPGSSLN